MNTLTNGNVPQANAAIKACQDKEMLAKWLVVEQGQQKPRKGVITALNAAIKAFTTASNNDDASNNDENNSTETNTETETIIKPVVKVSKESQKPVPDKKNKCWHVVATVNMPLKAGLMLKTGEVCEISEEDYERLSEDARGPFWIK